MRLMLTTLLLFGLMGMAQAQDEGTVGAASPLPHEDIMGTWNVVVKPTEFNTCDEPGQRDAVQWLITQRDFDVAVKVVGTTAFPSLEGTLSGKELTLEAAGSRALGSGFASVYPSSAFNLTLKGNKLTGKRYLLKSKAKLGGGGTVLCLAEFTVTATKQ